MDAAPIAPAPHPRAHRPSHGASSTKRRPAAGHVRTAAPATAAQPAPADDVVLQKQRAFDLGASLLAEGEREANALRAMAIAQLKRDDQTMNDWIRLI